jgi:uncharacterized protein YjiS (DUF1127 family)
MTEQILPRLLVLLEPAIGFHSRPAAALTHALGAWIGRRRQRLALANLTEDDGQLLDDIGLSRSEARREAAKPFWTP